jgi:hypothetical protein
MDRFFGEVKVDMPTSYPPAGKAARASSRAKAGFLAACVVLGAYLSFTQESRNAVAAAAPQLPGEMQGLMVHLAAKGADSAAMQIRNRFYNQQAGVYCGEVNGLDSRGGELKFKDGVRVFVCSPGGRERDSQ